MQFKTYQEAIENLDWNLLQRQKRTIEKVLSSSTRYLKIADIPSKDLTDLWGLIEFVENLEDVHENEMPHEEC